MCVSQALIDPTGRLVATTDGYGRVLLLSADTLQVLRVWKGYRDAQIGWILTQDAYSSIGSVGMGLYLAIFSPARAQVEVWRTVNGPRVSVLHVNDPHHARLVSTCSAGVIEGATSVLASECSLLTMNQKNGAWVVALTRPVVVGPLGVLLVDGWCL